MLLRISILLSQNQLIGFLAVRIDSYFSYNFENGEIRI